MQEFCENKIAPLGFTLHSDEYFIHGVENQGNSEGLFNEFIGKNINEDKILVTLVQEEGDSDENLRQFIQSGKRELLN